MCVFGLLDCLLLIGLWLGLSMGFISVLLLVVLGVLWFGLLMFNSYNCNIDFVCFGFIGLLLSV